MLSSSLKSSILLTDQTRYSQNVYNSSISNIRNRINLLSHTGSTQLKYYNSTAAFSQNTIKPSTGMYAKLSKISFDCEMLEQQVKTQLLESKKTKKYFDIVNSEISHRIQRLEHHLDLRIRALNSQIGYNIKKNQKAINSLNQQCQRRVDFSNELKKRMEKLQNNVKIIQDNLGFYTGIQKFNN